jgi:hypothetical protein
VFIGDIVHSHTVQFDKPETAIEYDIDPKKAVETRLKQFANFAKNGQTIAAPHLPFPALDIFIQQMEKAINGFLYILKIKTNELILGNKKATSWSLFYYHFIPKINFNPSKVITPPAIRSKTALDFK